MDTAKSKLQVTFLLKWLCVLLFGVALVYTLEKILDTFI